MKRYLLLLILFISVGAAAQNQAYGILHEAAHCLATDSHQWLDPETIKGTEIHLGMRYDTKTFLGDKYLYVVVFTSPKRDAGKIFDIRYKQQSHQHVYIVENVARFTITPKGVEFPEPPVGGSWAQNQITPALQQIVRHKGWTDEMKYLLKPENHIQCETTLDAK